MRVCSSGCGAHSTIASGYSLCPFVANLMRSSLTLCLALVDLSLTRSCFLSTMKLTFARLTVPSDSPSFHVIIKFGKYTVNTLGRCDARTHYIVITVDTLPIDDY